MLELETPVHDRLHCHPLPESRVAALYPTPLLPLSYPETLRPIPDSAAEPFKLSLHPIFFAAAPVLPETAVSPSLTLLLTPVKGVGMLAAPA